MMSVYYLPVLTLDVWDATGSAPQETGVCGIHIIDINKLQFG